MSNSPAFEALKTQLKMIAEDLKDLDNQSSTEVLIRGQQLVLTMPLLAMTVQQAGSELAMPEYYKMATQQMGQ